jgi:uncharacterized membrane protein
MNQQDQQTCPAEETPTPLKPEPSMPSAQTTPNVQTNPNLIAILSYLSILVFIPYFIASNNSFVRFHVSQGITLFVFEILLYVVSAIFGFMMSGLLYMIIDLLQLFLLVLAIIGIINVVKNKTDPLPVIGRINILSL